VKHFIYFVTDVGDFIVEGELNWFYNDGKNKKDLEYHLSSPGVDVYFRPKNIRSIIFNSSGVRPPLVSILIRTKGSD